MHDVTCCTRMVAFRHGAREGKGGVWLGRGAGGGGRRAYAGRRARR